MKKVKRGEVILFFLLAVLLIYSAFACSAIWYKGIPFDDFVHQTMDSFMQPQNFRVNEILKSFLIIAGVIWLLIFAAYIVSRGKFMFGREMGSAEWGNVEKINKHIMQKENVILSKHLKMGLNMQAPPIGHGRQLNTIVIGGSGSGKTWRYVTPNLLEANCSYVVVDPAGDVLRNTGYFFEKQGYNIKVLNLVDMEQSDAFNPWEYCKDQNQFQVMVDSFWKSTEDPLAQKGDQFWDESAKSLMLAIVFYLWETHDIVNFHSISALASFAEPEGEESPLDELFDKLYQENPDSLAVWFYESFRKGAAQTKQSILQVLNAKLFRTKTRVFEEMTAYDDIQLEELYNDPKQKSILYLIIPTMNATYNFLVSMLYMLLFESINTYYPQHGRCKQHLRILMDEAANIALPKNDFEKVISVCRKYNFSIVFILQGISQLKIMFERERWESVMANMDTIIYLGSQEQSSHEYFSKALGKATIDYKTRGYSRGLRGNASENIQITGRELMTAEEIGHMDNEDCLVFVRDERPIKDKKYDVRQHPNFAATMEGGVKMYVYQPQREFEAAKLAKTTEFDGKKIVAALLDWENLTPLGKEWVEADVD